MPIIDDDEFGRITIRRTSGSSMRASVAPNGTLRVSVPRYAPMFMVRRMIASARNDFRKLLESKPKLNLADGMPIGKSHSLHVRKGQSFAVRNQGLQVSVTLGPDDSLVDKNVVESVRKQMHRILRKESKAHLPKRIEYLAQIHGFEFTTLRFTHASSRWGSCNSNKAISLNIALMSLPFELIDYVLIHELAHTVHLNHSKDFWNEVARANPDYLVQRKTLKRYNPAI
jgi:predicted metal-dependent hydrolase